jgi:hypothetical protein
MMVSSTGPVQAVVSGVALVVFYTVVLWRIVKRNLGNRVIECGSLALVVVFIMVAAMKIPSLPDWAAPGLGILFLLLGFLMIFFLIQQGYRAIRRRKDRT